MKSLVILLTYASERNSRGTFCDRLLRQCRDYLLPVLGASPDDAGVADLLLLPAFEASADIAEEPETFALSVVVFFLLLFLLLLLPAIGLLTLRGEGDNRQAFDQPSGTAKAMSVPP